MFHQWWYSSNLLHHHYMVQLWQSAIKICNMIWYRLCSKPGKLVCLMLGQAIKSQIPTSLTNMLSYQPFLKFLKHFQGQLKMERPRPQKNRGDTFHYCYFLLTCKITQSKVHYQQIMCVDKNLKIVQFQLLTNEIFFT